MKRPYYIHTPRNIWGESLVGPDPLHQSSYHIRAVHTGQISHGDSKDQVALRNRVNELNDAHERMLAYAMHI